MHEKRTTCRSCGNRQLEQVLSLGSTPLANSFLDSAEQAAQEASYPLELYFCPRCTLVQLLDVIDPEVLFRDYIYTTGTSDTIARHNQECAATVVEHLGLGPDDLVAEIASNDGSLLSRFRDRGVRTLGIEPATNIARLARDRGIETVNEFFNLETARQVLNSHGPAKVVIGNNVLAHVDDTVDFLQGCASLVHDEGRVICEVPYIEEMLDRTEYDTIYHEHLCYFSVSALMHLFETAGLRVTRVDRMPVHGGTVRIYAGRVDEHGEDALALAEHERERGFTGLDAYRRFAEGVEQNRRQLRELLIGLRDAGHTLAGYGAPAKGNTLLNYCKIGTDLLPFTVDKSPLKVGKLTPGMHIPVLPATELVERMPDYTVILAWNFADEVIRQQQAYRDRGGKFIIPIPTPRVEESR